MEQSYFTFLYYYGQYRICQTPCYEFDLTADDEDQARDKFKSLKPDANIKQVQEWGKKSDYLV